jgi:3-dehydroquinate synthase
LFGWIEERWRTFEDPPTRCAAIRDTVWRSVERMLEQLAPNLYEDRSFERVVDLGHTFSPLLESVSQHTLLHGEAVAIDIALSSLLASGRGTMTAHESGRVVSLLQSMSLPVWSEHLTPETCRLALEEASRHRGGRTNLVLPVGIGSATFVRDSQDIPDAEIGAALRALRGFSRHAPLS